MSRHGLYLLILGLIFVLSPINEANAHSGHKKKAVEKEAPAAESSIYAVGEEEAPSGEADIFSSRTDALSDEMPMAPESMEHMDHNASGSMDHKMSKVEIAKREWVSPKSKGYGVAAGITVFAGLVFGGLYFKRPNE